MIKTVLAIDSSLACPAFAVLEFNLIEKKVTVKEVTHVKTSSKRSTGYRLTQIHSVADRLLKRYKFDAIVFEKGFNKFAVATQQIQRTVGMLLFTLYRNDIEDIEEIAPTSVKKYITGDGKASKEKLADHLIYYVGEIKYKTNDESDAVGVGIAYGKKMGWL